MMRLSARADYAVRACIELARRPDLQMSTEALAMYADVPGKFLEAIVVDLRKANVIRTQRGPRGGCLLTRSPAEISLADIVIAIDGPIGTVRGEAPHDLHYPISGATLQQVWIGLAEEIVKRLQSVTLADLVRV